MGKGRQDRRLTRPWVPGMGHDPIGDFLNWFAFE